MEEYDGQVIPFMTHIPETTIKLTIRATILDENDCFHEAEMNLGLADIRDGLIDAEEWMRDNAKYVLTDKAKEELDTDEY